MLYFFNLSLPLCCPPLPPAHTQISSGRRVVPTELGITLIKGYQLIDPELCRPQVRYECTGQSERERGAGRQKNEGDSWRVRSHGQPVSGLTDCW